VPVKAKLVKIHILRFRRHDLNHVHLIWNERVTRIPLLFPSRVTVQAGNTEMPPNLLSFDGPTEQDARVAYRVNERIATSSMILRMRHARDLLTGRKDLQGKLLTDLLIRVLSHSMSETCSKCGGSGFAYDPAELREKRIKSGHPQNVIARRMKITASYLSDLENGRRDWDATLVSDFQKALRSP